MYQHRTDLVAAIARDIRGLPLQHTTRGLTMVLLVCIIIMYHQNSEPAGRPAGHTRIHIDELV